MAAERLSMRQLKEVLRQKWVLGRSHRQIATSVGISAGSVGGAVCRATAAGLDWKQVEELIASQKGKVVVVDMWSLSCAPCRREFPNLVKLHNEKSDQVACVSVSTDYAGIKSKPVESYEPKVLEFLTEQKSTLTNVLCSTEADEVFDTLSLASIPAVYVYGKDGTLAQISTKWFGGDITIVGK